MSRARLHPPLPEPRPNDLRPVLEEFASRGYGKENTAAYREPLTTVIARPLGKLRRAARAAARRG